MYRVTQMPLRPALPVRPLRCTYVSTSGRPLRLSGGLFWITRSTIMSRPRAATSVAMSTRNFPFRNASMVCSRVFCGMSPCRALFSNLRLSSTLNSLHSSFVSQNTITLPAVPPNMAMVSEMVPPLDCQWHGIVRCLTSVEAFTALLPTTSMVSGLDMYFFATSATHLGMVALNRQVCRLALVHAPKMISMSSANPMSSIWSASSSTANLQRVAKSKVCFSRWSFTRPGVPTTTSTPSRRLWNWGGYGEPP
mmetsp:Transcript_79257/g.155034  ORF Transcript_79257/g.155034 Transcript_79257/m.155034 type:complete len:251 (-) Transcript_79257:648-1400(-)